MNGNSYPTFSVVVPTFRRAELLGLVLDAIDTESLQAQEMLVVYRPDDDPETVQWIASNAAAYPTLQAMPIYITGKVAAQNLALSHAKG